MSEKRENNLLGGNMSIENEPIQNLEQARQYFRLFDVLYG